MNYSTKFEKPGRVVDTTDVSEKAENMKWSEASDVEAYISQYPAGISIDSHNQTLNVDDKKWEIIGHVSADYKTPPLAGIFWFYDYPEDQSWRKALCYWQVPINWVTLSFWAFLSPAYWPCIVLDNSNDADQIGKRKMRVVNNLKKITKAVDGDTIVITSLGNVNVVNAYSGQTIAGVSLINGEGWALRRKKAISNPVKNKK
ncbi:hypothetical protein [Leptospira gomenensis]|uniref:hypothetical protein n=1 Tax=Leptospira gomenensis TaxID=2484974 RepID=UPI001AF01CA8|nr:hypothetical protein [Leptospira gomenensis]